MSAIAGFWSFDGVLGAREMAERMGEALAVHGPDSAGAWGDRDVALAWRGRTVLPEDPFDQQPRSGRSSAVLAADCRIDNRRELRDRLGLEEGGAPLPDSAFVLAAYEAWGERCVDHLVGDFAFVVWDARRRHLFAARDHMGLRPLYFRRGRGFVAVASMPKGLFALPGVPRTLNQVKLLDTLLLLAETGTDTVYEAVERIPPGHALIVTEDGPRLASYWEPTTAPRLALASDDEYQEAFEETFEEAVRCRLRSISGPIATQLSSGFDSSSVTTLAAEQLAGEGRRLVALTAAPPPGFRGPVPRGRFADEDRYAAMTVAQHANAEHVVVREGRGLLADVGAFTRAAEIPLLNLCNQIWLSAIGRAAHSSGARVMLGARGGNMTISHQGEYHTSDLVRSGRWVALARELSVGARRPGGSWKRGIKQALFPTLRNLAYRLGPMRTKAYRKITALTAVDHRRYPQAVFEARAKACGVPLAATWLDSLVMRVSTLRRVDEGPFFSGYEAMFGVQPVDPTLDKRLVELCLAIPEGQYQRDGENRRLLRRMMTGRLPAAMMSESRKGYQGAAWYDDLRAEMGPIAEEIERFAQSATAAGLLDIAGLRDDLRTVPDGGWDDMQTVSRYRYRLLRGVALGSFICLIEAPSP